MNAFMSPNLKPHAGWFALLQTPAALFHRQAKFRAQRQAENSIDRLVPTEKLQMIFAGKIRSRRGQPKHRACFTGLCGLNTPVVIRLEPDLYNLAPTAVLDG